VSQPVAGSTKQESRRHFDRWSSRYEDDPVSRFIAEAQDSAFEMLGLGGDDRFLDVGCGSGAAVRRAAPLVERSVGVDLSEGMLRRADELAAGLEGVEFVEGDAEALPFEDGEFTAVLCTTSFHHYPEPFAALREMRRVLAPGGRAVIGDGCTDNPGARVLNLLLRTFQPSHVNFYASGRLSEMVREAGLRAARTRLLWRGGYQILEARKEAI